MVILIIKKVAMRLHGDWNINNFAVLLQGIHGKTCDQVVHFFFTADIVSAIENVLLLGFGQVGISVHGSSVLRQCHAKSNGNFVEIHNVSSSAFRADVGIRPYDTF